MTTFAAAQFGRRSGRAAGHPVVRSDAVRLPVDQHRLLGHGCAAGSGRVDRLGVGGMADCSSRRISEIGTASSADWISGVAQSRHLLIWMWITGYFVWMGSAWVKSIRYQLPIYPFLSHSRRSRR